MRHPIGAWTLERTLRLMLMRLDETTRYKRLEALAGYHILLHWRDLNADFHFAFSHETVTVRDQGPSPDLTLRGGTLGLVGLVLREDTSGVELEGDLALAQALSGLLDGLLPGNLPDQSMNRLCDMIGEYLQQESGQLPARTECEHFMREVDRLRDDLERAAIRLQRLDQRHR